MIISSAAAATRKPLPLNIHFRRTFIAVRVKWVRDPYLDKAVAKEKDLIQAISLKNQIISSSSNSLPLISASLLKTPLNLPIAVSKFCNNYSAIFNQFQPSPCVPFRIRLTPQAYAVHKEEVDVQRLVSQRDDAVKRLARLLMLTKSTRLPLDVIDRFKFDLGLAHNYVPGLLSDYPEYFQVCEWNNNGLALELVNWKHELAVSELERRGERGFRMNLPLGFDLKKKVMDWVQVWQDLPYISPYENAFHLPADGDQAEKWTVAVLHELLWLLVSKKTELNNIVTLGELLGFNCSRFKNAIKHHPGIFYVSNKIRTQTVVLREAYRKDMIIEKHPLMGMRYRYIHLMNKPRTRKTLRRPSLCLKNNTSGAINNKQA